MNNHRQVEDFPKVGNYIGNLIKLLDGSIYEWVALKGGNVIGFWSRL